MPQRTEPSVEPAGVASGLTDGTCPWYASLLVLLATTPTADRPWIWVEFSADLPVHHVGGSRLPAPMGGRRGRPRIDLDQFLGELGRVLDGEDVSALRNRLQHLGATILEAAPGCRTIHLTFDHGGEPLVVALFERDGSARPTTSSIRIPLPTGVLADSSAVAQAVGALLGQGWLPEEARPEIDRRARQAGISRAAAARLILLDLLDTDRS